MAHSKEVNLGEIVTNVPAHFMQRTFATSNSHLWFYGWGSRTHQAMQQRYVDNANGTFHPGFNEGLFLLVHLLELSGDAEAAWARVDRVP